MTTLTSPAPAALTSSSRVLAPDLARGLMLLLIALANTPWYLYGIGSGYSTIHPPEGLSLDRVVQFVIITAVDGRIYPMFAFLFGYGIVQMYQRSLDRGAEPRAIRRVLRRRHLWMIVIGAVHAALLWVGDIVATYGLVGLVFTALFLKRKSRTLIVWAGVFTGLLTVGAVLAVVGSVLVAQEPPPPETVNFMAGMKDVNAIPSWPASILPRLSTWAILLILQGFLTLVIPVAVLLAFWAARQGILGRPEQHRRLLIGTAITGLVIGWGGGAVHAFEHLGMLGVPHHVTWVFSATTPVTGLFGGLGYIALFGLVAGAVVRRHRDQGPVTTAITAVGKRSLSAYLAQSVICAPLLCAWGLGLGAILGSAATAALAIAVWLVTVLGCAVLERKGRRGPAEWLLRRLAYGRPAASRRDVRDGSAGTESANP